jgi:hypothetical protein
LFIFTKLTDSYCFSLFPVLFFNCITISGGDPMATEAQRRAAIAYNKRQDNIMVRPSKEDGAAIRAAAAAAGQSVQRYILDAVAARMAADQATQPRDD